MFLTHLHSDHITDFDDVVTTRWMMSVEPNPLPVFGPAGTAAFVEATEAMLEPDIRYRITHHDDLTWPPTADVTEGDRGGSSFTTAPSTSPRPPPSRAKVRPTLGYRIDNGGRRPS